MSSGLPPAMRFPDAEALTRRALACAPGPGYLSADWEDSRRPAPVTAVITRVRADGWIFAAIASIDRTCLGVRGGSVEWPMSPDSFDYQFLTQYGRMAVPLVAVDPLVVRSVVFHAIDYAAKLGFMPGSGFPEALYAPRPDELLPTAWSNPDHPIYIQQPGDDFHRIRGKLMQAVGDGNYEIVR